MTRLGADGSDLPVLVPNERGLDRALELGLEHIAIFGSATETFARSNLNRSLDEQFAMFEPTVERARDAGLDVRAYVSMCFGDPWEGAVPSSRWSPSAGGSSTSVPASSASATPSASAPPARSATLIDAFVAARACRSTTSPCTSTTPTGRRWPTPTRRCRPGVTTYDASAGGLGGCPYAKSATGNLATEDLVWLLTGLGIEHGVDLDALVATSAWMAGRARPARLPRPWSARCHNRQREPATRLPPRGRAEDRDDVRPGPAGPQRGLVATARRTATRPGSARRHVPGRARPPRPALGRAAAAGRGASGTRSCAARAGARGHGRASATRSWPAPSPARRARALADLSFAEVHIVYTARDIARQVAAEWQEQLKHQRKVSFRTFLRQLRETDQRKSARWFWRVQGLPGVLERWGSGLPPAQVHLVTVPQPGAPHGELWRRFCTRGRHRPGLGAGGQRAPQPVDRDRREHPAAPAQRAGSRTPGCRPTSTARWSASSSSTRPWPSGPGCNRWSCRPTPTTGPRRSRSPGSTGPRASGVDVVGDLEELRPLRPADRRRVARPRQAAPARRRLGAASTRSSR